jgi:hypothetical protein
MSLEAALGRWLAFCVHPYSAWRRLSRSGRLLLVSSYFGAAYVIVLGLLLGR